MNSNSVSDFLISKNNLSISPRKINIVSRVLRKMNFDYSLSFLSSKSGILKRGGYIIFDLLSAAKKNIEFQKKRSSSDYFINKIIVNKSFMRKKISYRARGRSNIVKRRYSSIKIILSPSI